MLSPWCPLDTSSFSYPKSQPAGRLSHTLESSMMRSNCFACGLRSGTSETESKEAIRRHRKGPISCPMPIASAAASNSFRASSRSSLISSFHSFEKDDFHGNPARGGGGQQRSGLEYSHSEEEQCEEETVVYKGKLGWLRRKCGDIVDDERTQMFILLLIAINR